MAHRVAELMSAVEKAGSVEKRNRLERECTDLILALWRFDRGSSRDNPIHDMNRILNQIGDMRPPAWRRYQLIVPGVHPVLPSQRKDPSMNEIVSHLIRLGDQEQELLFALVAADLPKELPEDVEAAEQIHRAKVDRTKCDKLLADLQQVHNEPMAKETPLIIDAKTQKQRQAHFVRAMRRVLREKGKLAQQLALL
jgi:hypothetical protein